MDVPKTVTTALEDRPVEGAVCLEAGAGAGNTTAGLLIGGADRVYAITNDREHAHTTVDHLLEDEETHGGDDGTDWPERLAVLEGDLREIPLPDDSVDFITAHGLFNVLPPADLEAVAAELTRVAAPGCHLVIDDYEPLPDDAAVRELFALENAAAELADGQSALTFYPAAVLRRLFAGYGWAFDRRRTLLEPVPWTEQHLAAHADVVREQTDRLPDSSEVGETLVERADRLAESIGSESVGEMYSVAMRLPA